LTPTGRACRDGARCHGVVAAHATGFSGYDVNVKTVSITERPAGGGSDTAGLQGIHNSLFFGSGALESDPAWDQRL
jgi:hypothetical protein